MKQVGNTGNANRLLENLPLGIEMNLSLCSKVQKSSANLFVMPLLAIKYRDAFMSHVVVTLNLKEIQYMVLRSQFVVIHSSLDMNLCIGSKIPLKAS